MFIDNHSRGCQSCQQGKWLCIFLTYLCNTKCHFCPAPPKHDEVHSAFGSNPEQILKYLKILNFNGIGFSGGDPFIVFERLIDWLDYFKTHLSDYYYWVYTNGLAVNENKLERLAKKGLDEIRFNIAATGYTSDRLLDKIKTATSIIKYVTIEIPSIPGDFDKLTSVLPYLDQINVKYLNLHEYILQGNDPNIHCEQIDSFELNKNINLMYSQKSIENTLRISEFCRLNKLKLKINNCSLIKKENQMRNRRIEMGNLLKNENEDLSEDGLLSSCYVYPGNVTLIELERILAGKNDFISIEKFRYPNGANIFKKKENGSTVFKLTYLPPMEINQSRKLLEIELLNKNDKQL